MTSIRRLVTLLAIAFVVIADLSVGVSSARAENISGTLNTTKTLTENSQFTGNVTCAMIAAPCILIGAPGITLKMNGFSMTGSADPVTGCSGINTPGEVGISTGNQADVTIQGPGLLQRFRAVGLNASGSNRLRVVNVTASTNCVTGIVVANSSDSHIEGNVVVRNGQANAASGGIYILNAQRNRILRNHATGNGYVDQGSVPANDFGIGLDGSSDNLIEGNVVMSNSNGIFVGSTSTGNIIRGNLATGNPSIQISNTFPQNSGVDIRNGSAAGVNTFTDNLCLTSINVSCPNVPPAPDLIPTVLTAVVDPGIVPTGGSFNVTFSGNNLTSTTYFDVRFSPPGGGAEQIGLNWQQGTSVTHEVARSTPPGNWTITGVRAHEDLNDHAGPFAPVSATIAVTFVP